MGIAGIPAQTYRRLPGYYTYIKSLWEQGEARVSAPAIAQALHLNEVQVRKDLAAVSKEGGRPRMGFSTAELYGSIRECLGYDNVSDAVLVGVGQLGRALLNYVGFAESGVQIVAAFDSGEAVIGQTINGKPVFPVSDMQSIVPRLRAHIGILTVPGEAAQEVCERMIQCGIQAIWNFAPVHLDAPKPILVQNENLAASLALLSNKLEDAMHDDRGIHT